MVGKKYYEKLGGFTYVLGELRKQSYIGIACYFFAQEPELDSANCYNDKKSLMEAGEHLCQKESMIQR